MISVILYGRNDTYGYNLHKRAAISLNCMAEVLSHPDDEIIFVDCNTPEDMPTFSEAIQDTLTPKAKRLLRILRLRPYLYEKYKKGSPLKALEPLSRNIAIRRSNPSNRWILSTNTDMVFVVREPEKSLSEVVKDLPDGLYELPRFEVPESLWESVNRTEPQSVIATFRKWGQRLHLNEVITASPDIRFDGPGDFQLMLREQLFKIHGFNEEMVLGWHLDSNLCRRLFILNGKTDSLLDRVFAYHCDHTRQATFLHGTKRTENSIERFVNNISSPFLPQQTETWGIPHEEIDEIRLTDEYLNRLGKVLESLLPGMSEVITTDVFSEESYNHGQIYDNLHMFPFLSDHLSNIPSSANIGYFGGNVKLLHLLSEFLSRSGHKGHILVDSELITTAFSREKPYFPEQCKIVDKENLVEQCDIFVFDVGMMHLPQMINEGVLFPKSSRETEYYREKLKDSFLICADYEKKRLISGHELPRKFLLISSQHTWFERETSKIIGTTLTPYSTHIRHGYLRDAPYLLSLPSFSTMFDDSLKDVVDFIKEHATEGERLIGPTVLGMLFPGRTYPYSETISEEIDVQWAVIHKGMIGEIDPRFLNRVNETMRPVFANEEFVVFSIRKELPEVNQDSQHYKSFLENLKPYLI